MLIDKTLLDQLTGGTGTRIPRGMAFLKSFAKG